MSTSTPRPSKITVPKHANPFAKLVFSEMQKQRITYWEMEMRTSVLVSTIKAWRNDNVPGLMTIEACLGALGYQLVAIPKPETLSESVREQLECFSEHFRSDAEAFGAAIAIAAEWPEYARENLSRVARCSPFGRASGQTIAAPVAEAVGGHA